MHRLQVAKDERLGHWGLTQETAWRETGKEDDKTTTVADTFGGAASLANEKEKQKGSDLSAR